MASPISAQTITNATLASATALTAPAGSKYADVQAIGVMEAASELGVRVPEQLSVIGYDDLEIASLLGITTVRQQLELSGQRGAAHVIEAINGDGSHGAQEKIDVEVIVRNTTRPPK